MIFQYFSYFGGMKINTLCFGVNRNCTPRGPWPSAPTVASLGFPSGISMSILHGISEANSSHSCWQCGSGPEIFSVCDTRIVLRIRELSNFCWLYFRLVNWDHSPDNNNSNNNSNNTNKNNCKRIIIISMIKLLLIYIYQIVNYMIYRNISHS